MQLRSLEKDRRFDVSWVKYDASQYGFYLLGGVGASNEEPAHCTQGIGWSNLWFSCYHYYLRLSCLLYSIQCL